MAQDYEVLTRSNATPQNKPIAGREKEMHKNAAGGYVFGVTAWDQLRRFLITGSSGGTYYVTARDLSMENMQNIKACIDQDGKRVVDTIVEISDKGIAAKNDPALFALALAASAHSLPVRQYALENLSKVARIPTHLFTFWKYVRTQRGMGRSLVNAIRQWYQHKSASQLAYHMTKYQQREGMSQRDMLRLTHPRPLTTEQEIVFGYATDKVRYEDGQFWSYVSKLDKNDPAWKTTPPDQIWVRDHVFELPSEIRILEGVEKIKFAGTPQKAAKIIVEYGLTHEMVPNDLKNAPETWEALLPNLPLTALVRNLNKMTSIGLIKPLSDATKYVVEKLNDKTYIHKSRLHPLNLLIAHKTYGGGKGMRGSLEWKPVQNVYGALEDAFYLSFDNVEPTGLNTLIALDVSGSMSWGHVAGLDMMTPAEVSTCMAMVTARTEANYHIMGFATDFRDLKITAKDSLHAAMKKTNGLSFGGTDCALPMKWAYKNQIPVDTFVVYTDNETWAGQDGHPSEWLVNYRKHMDRASRLIVCATQATHGTIADPNDPGMIDICGFGTDTPSLISAFAKGEF